MRGRTFIVLILASCGKLIGTDANPEPAPAPTPGSGTSSSSSSGDSGRPQTADGSVPPTACTTSRECPKRKCQPNAADSTTGTCDPNASCLDDAEKVKVDEHCTGVVPCLGFRCYPLGIIAGPTGIFACGIPGDACTDEIGHHCCNADCIHGQCN